MFKLHHRSFRQWGFTLLFCLSLITSLWLQPSLADQTSPTTQSADQQVQQGVDRYEAGDIQGAIQQWQAALSVYQTTQTLANQAIVLENLARASQSIGKTREALQYWQQAIEVYRQLANPQQIGRMLTEQAQTYMSLGEYRKAIALLCGSDTASACVETSALRIAQQQRDSLGEIAAWGSFGETQRLLGNDEQAIDSLTTAMKLVQAQQVTAFLSPLKESLANVAVNQAETGYRRAILAEEIGDRRQADALRQVAKEKDREALQQFQESLTVTQKPSQQAQILLHSIPSAYRVDGVSGRAAAAIHRVQSQMEQLPATQEKVYLAIDLARLLTPLTPDHPFPSLQCAVNTDPQVLPLLEQAVATATQIGDRRSQSFAVGELGHFYECNGDAAEALRLTQDARRAAEQEPDSRYLWEWQTGRLLKAQQKNTDAIAAYEQAVNTVESIRDDLLTAKRDLQFDFRDTIEPVYRELVELQLQQAPPSVLLPASQDKQSNLNAPLKTLNSLKLAELQNYFGSDCPLLAVTQNPVDIANLSQKAAIFSSIILADRTAIVVRFPDGQQQFEWIDQDRDMIRNEIIEYRKGLEAYYDVNYNPQPAQTLYDRLIHPFDAALTHAEIKTLVFVQDGILRNVPMSALHDGERFLVERYAIATTPSITLTSSQPPDRRNLKALAVGLSQSAIVGERRFSALENVTAEIQSVVSVLPNSKPLLDQNFTRARLQQELDRQNYSILHVATHGEFGTEPQDTFLVTGDDQKLTINDLDQLLRTLDPEHPVELLSLTACQTAIGNDRAALGLAGAAAQAGVKSVLASLWFIQDQATAKLATQFYEGIYNMPTLSKAEALAAAQRSLIQAGGTNAHPAYWSPFILIGNWL